MINKIDENNLKLTLNKKKKDIIINDFNISQKPIIMAGPCAIDNYESLYLIAKSLKENNCKIIRGGAFKPRTSPYDFQGFQIDALKNMYKIKKEFDLIAVSELTSIKYIDELYKYIDIIQIGARNMQNFELLKEVGKMDKPILLKRGFCSTIYEWLSACEYILYNGNENIILCERGIRTFETFTRNTVDLSAVAILKDITNFPIIVDPSHGVGIKKYVPALCKGAIATGADGIMIEVHNQPDNALSDDKQTINLKTFNKLCKDINTLSTVLENI